MVEYSERRLTNVFSALADPHRRWIIRRLSQHPCAPSELTKPLHMSLQGVIKHVAVLERAGLAHTEKRGRKRIVTIDAAALQAASSWLEHYRAFWENKLDSLAAHLEATSPSPSTQSPGAKNAAPANPQGLPSQFKKE